MSEIRRRVLISGIVQGVCFRAYTQDAARSAGVNGWVRNLPDGRVEAVFEGPTENVDRVVAWCRKGPPTGKVERVDVVEERHTGEFDGFEIAYHGRRRW
jgi:acylphosphatase